MITNSFMVTISHSDSSFWPICLGYFHPFTALEVYILTNIYCWCTNQYSIQMVQSNSVYVSGCRFDRNRFDRDRFELPWTENESRSRNRFNRDHKLHRNKILTKITGLLSHDRMSGSESGNYIKTFQYYEERTFSRVNNEFCLKKEDSKDQHIDW
jgi:hypothetical protein